MENKAKKAETKIESDQLEFVEIRHTNMQDAASINIPEMTVEEGGNEGTWFSGPVQKMFPAKAAVAREWISNRKQGLRPWREFVKTDQFKVPSGVVEVGQRITRNVDYFQSNYICVFVILVIYCILTSPMLLIALVALFGMLYVIKVRNQQKKLNIGGKELSPAAQYAAVACISFPLFWIAGAGSAIFWVIGASIFVIVLHAVFFNSIPQAGGDFLQENV